MDKLYWRVKCDIFEVPHKVKSHVYEAKVPQTLRLLAAISEKQFNCCSAVDDAISVSRAVIDQESVLRRASTNDTISASAFILLDSFLKSSEWLQIVKQ